MIAFIIHHNINLKRLFLVVAEKKEIISIGFGPYHHHLHRQKKVFYYSSSDHEYPSDRHDVEYHIIIINNNYRLTFFDTFIRACEFFFVSFGFFLLRVCGMCEYFFGSLVLLRMNFDIYFLRQKTCIQCLCLLLNTYFFFFG